MANLRKKQLSKNYPSSAFHKGDEPEYVVQVSEPGMVRRDLLEGLREIIIFMQGYEKFRSIQEEKVAQFTRLKIQVKELNYLIETKLHRFFPKGKLRSAHVKEIKEVEEAVPESEEAETSSPPISLPRKSSASVVKPKNELDELESQLKDIEGQLQSI